MWVMTRALARSNLRGVAVPVVREAGPFGTLLRAKAPRSGPVGCRDAPACGPRLPSDLPVRIWKRILRQLMLVRTHTRRRGFRDQ